MGLLLFFFCLIDVVCKVISIVKENGGIIFFDFNICKEMLKICEMLQVFEYIFDYMDFFLLSDGELDYFGLSKFCDEEKIVVRFYKCGIVYVIIKCGVCGVSYYLKDE